MVEKPIHGSSIGTASKGKQVTWKVPPVSSYTGSMFNRVQSRHLPLPAALVLLTLMSLLSCSPGTIDEEEVEDVEWVPREGVWVGATLGFEHTAGAIEEINLTRFGCVGNLTPSGHPLCESLITGSWELPIPSVSAGDEWVIETPFGLELQGTFQDEDRFFGTFTYEADNGCCQTEGTWSAVHESLAEETPPLPCHNTTGNENLILRPSVMEGEADTPVIAEGDSLLASPGFQGGVMVLLDLELPDIELGGNLTIELELRSEDGSIEAIAKGDTSLVDSEEALAAWRNIWLILVDGEDGGLLSLADLEGIEALPFTLKLEVSNNCGFLFKRTFEVGLTTEQGVER